MRAGSREAWVVGVDVDQYDEGLYDGKNSIILTSAMKQIKKATFDMIKAETEGKFPGGEILVFDAKTTELGFPMRTRNLRPDVVK